MSVHYTTRYACHPQDFATYDTSRLRQDFLVENLFESDQIQLVYTHFDRFIVGGAMPVGKDLRLDTIPPLKAADFLDGRELGIINIGAKGTVMVDGTAHELNTNDALYVGRGAKDVVFKAASAGQSYFYLNSAPAHASHPTVKVSEERQERVELGSIETSNHRFIIKSIVNSIVKTCQLQMGMTQLKPGSVWNTMPVHIHDRRMEAYLYFNLQEGQVVSHFLGQPNETRHIWVGNRQAVFSPPWSIHSGVGTSNYAFIWGMAGENLDYGDMEVTKPSDLR